MKKIMTGLVMIGFLHVTTTAQNKADLIIINGKVATMVKVNEYKQAVAIKDGIILDAPAGVWIKVVGGWNEYQFEEKRQPTLVCKNK